MSLQALGNWSLTPTGRIPNHYLSRSGIPVPVFLFGLARKCSRQRRNHLSLRSDPQLRSPHPLPRHRSPLVLLFSVARGGLRTCIGCQISNHSGRHSACVSTIYVSRFRKGAWALRHFSGPKERRGYQVVAHSRHCCARRKFMVKQVLYSRYTRRIDDDVQQYPGHAFLIADVFGRRLCTKSGVVRSSLWPKFLKNYLVATGLVLTPAVDGTASHYPQNAIRLPVSYTDA